MGWIDAMMNRWRTNFTSSHWVKPLLSLSKWNSHFRINLRMSHVYAQYAIFFHATVVQSQHSWIWRWADWSTSTQATFVKPLHTTRWRSSGIANCTKIPSSAKLFKQSKPMLGATWHITWDAALFHGAAELQHLIGQLMLQKKWQSTHNL